MTRYKLGAETADMPYPWGVDLFWDRHGVLDAGGKTYLLIKLGKGSLQEAVPAPLTVWEAGPQGLVDVTARLLGTPTNFAITRELLVADFNADGHDDFFLSNHGPEPVGMLFPGEQNALYIYQPAAGRYAQTLMPDQDFSHGSTVGDFDGDGRLDIYVHNLGSASGTPSYLLLQQTNGAMARTQLPTAYLSFSGPLNAAIDIDADGQHELASVVGRGELLIWQNLATEQPSTVQPALDLPISEKGVFEIRSADFDANGIADILVVGTGDEIVNSAGTVYGGTLKAIMVMDAGTPSQRVVEPLKALGIEQMATGGVRVELVDLDRSGTLDFELRTYDPSWQWHRYTVYTGRNDTFSVTHNADNTRAISASYLDVTGDGVLDLVSDQYGFLRIQPGELSLRVNGRAYDMDGQAGMVAKVLGAVFGKEALQNKTFVGIGLQLLEQGMDYDTLAATALSVVRANTPDEVVTRLWTNLVGQAPTAQEKAPFVQLLDEGLSPGTLARLAADSPLNQHNIDLVGLAQTGLEYLMPSMP